MRSLDAVPRHPRQLRKEGGRVAGLARADRATRRCRTAASSRLSIAGGLRTCRAASSASLAASSLTRADRMPGSILSRQCTFGQDLHRIDRFRERQAGQFAHVFGSRHRPSAFRNIDGRADVLQRVQHPQERGDRLDLGIVGVRADAHRNAQRPGCWSGTPAFHRTPPPTRDPSRCGCGRRDPCRPTPRPAGY